MGFLGIGTGEIILILILALIILGPGRITEIARTLGRTVRAIKKASSDLSATVSRELETTRNEPTPPDKTARAPSVASNAITQVREDRPDKPGEAPSTK
jgi:TatA/E family protein of Tat protein translocase